VAISEVESQRDSLVASLLAMTSSEAYAVKNHIFVTAFQVTGSTSKGFHLIKICYITEAMNQRAPKIVSFQTVGCRLNQYETERMAARLRPYVQRVVNQPTSTLLIPVPLPIGLLLTAGILSGGRHERIPEDELWSLAAMWNMNRTDWLQWTR